MALAPEKTMTTGRESRFGTAKGVRESQLGAGHRPSRGLGKRRREGPAEFAALWNSLGQWRAIFERFDRDLSGEIDSSELTNALLSLGYAVPPSVIQVLMTKYNDGKYGRGALNFDSFVECGVLVKGLTEKFKEKDTGYTGSSTISYDDFMLMIIPFLVA